MAAAHSWDSDAPLVIAHRGASARAPENTLAAFRLAASMGADGIELDAKLTRDESIVVHHDRTLERTTNGRGMVSQLTLREIRTLDAGSSFDASFADEPVPTLQEVLEAVGDSLLVNIELTNYADPFDSLPFRALSLVEELSLQEHVLYSSFNPIALRRLRGKVQQDRLALLLFYGQPWIVRALFERLTPHGWIHPQLELATKAWAGLRRERGSRLNVWTVNDRAEMMACFDLGVDGIITDLPNLALDARRDFLEGMV